MAADARHLRAAWSGAWRAPWPVGKGRRFGDLPWALASVGIAWIQGGAEGAWPVQPWEAGPGGPHPQGPIARWRERPDPAWIALLRHGSSNVPADRPGSREDVLESMAWEALLRGEALPFLHLGLAHLDQHTRASWVPLLGAVDEEGRLHLPPFLAPLIPDALKALPRGWWETLLGTMDRDGLLLPSGAPPPHFSAWSAAELKPFTLSHPPEGPSAQDCIQTAKGVWMVDPGIRAWARGDGAHPGALLALQPMNLGLGADPDPLVRDLLDFKIPHDLPEAWRSGLEVDLTEGPYPEAPPLLGHPTFDWLRVRWGAPCPAPSPGYPETPLGSSCDPFYHLSAGWMAYHAQQPEQALWAFAFAWALFKKLKSEPWAKRAAHNGAGAARFWGDLARSKTFQKAAGTLKPPFDTLQDIHDLILGGEFELALQRVDPMASHPRIASQLQALRIHCLINLGAWEELRALHPNTLPEDLAALVEAIRTGIFHPRPAGLDDEGALLWESVRARVSGFDAKAFWDAWSRCPNALMRLGAGLLVMEAHEEARLPGRLAHLQELAHRCGSSVLRQRLARLWPMSSEAPLPPMELLQTVLDQHPGPAWALWGAAFEHRAGKGDLPPGALEDLLPHRTALEPFAFGEWVWWGRALAWEDAPAGWVLLGFPADRPMAPPPWADLLAPWTAQLNATAAPLPAPESHVLLTNGSEPMATFLRELDHVAQSRLSVLIQGPSGSGKELAAREVHLRSGRKGPLVAVNCSEFASGVLESELFGHVKGAFTGAMRDKTGAIESARNGTLFLDEIADLEPRLQSMLLRVIQEREIRRVGSDRAVPVDVRFVTATHRDLDLLAAQGHFRKDLLFRLQGARLRLPSLDERRHELPWLLPRLIAQICREEQLPVPALGPGIAQALARKPWPGNFRELRHILQRGLLRAKGATLKASHMPELQEPAALGKRWEDATRDFQRKHLLDTLKAHDFQVAETARSLGLARPALYAAAKRLGVDLVAERHSSR